MGEFLVIEASETNATTIPLTLSMERGKKSTAHVKNQARSFGDIVSLYLSTGFN